MKTPLILLATTLLIAGCSTNTAPLSDSTDVPESDFQSQTQEQYMQAVQEEISLNASLNQKAIDKLDVKVCQTHSDKELAETCELQVIMTMSAQGDKSLCKMLPEGEEKQLCLQ